MAVFPGSRATHGCTGNRNAFSTSSDTTCDGNSNYGGDCTGASNSGISCAVHRHLGTDIYSAGKHWDRHGINGEGNFCCPEMAGQAIGQLMGLMLASMVDPQNGNQVPVIGQFYLLLATLLFLILDGHLIMIQALVASFHQLPVGMDGISRDALWSVINWLGTILVSAVLIAMPAIAALLIVNLAFGVMTRAAPQLNIFAVGFPIMIILGVLIILFTLDSFVPHMTQLFEQSFDVLRKLMGS